MSKHMRTYIRRYISIHAHEYIRSCAHTHIGSYTKVPTAYLIN